MCEGDDFFTNMSPRISLAEIEEMWALGFSIQKEHTHGAQPGPIAVYPLFPDKFKERAKQFLESINSKSKRTSIKQV